MISVVCALIRDEQGRYLVCQRPTGSQLAGLWEFPGGKIEPGESLAAALTREIHEELGLVIRVTAALDPVVWHYPFATIQLTPCKAEILDGRPEPRENQTILWCHPDDFPSLSWAPADVPVCRSITAPNSALDEFN